jgi:peptide/nickel transport system substrate-binding protein
MGPPGVDYVTYAAIPDSNAAMQAFLEGQLDVTGITPHLLPLFSDKDEFVITRFPTGGRTNIAFRTDTPPFDDARVRKAVRVAIDRKKLIDMVLGPGGGEVNCDHPVQPDDQFRWPGTCEPDPELAKQLLQEAGYGSGFSFDVYTSNFFGLIGITLVEAYQQQMAQIGVKVNIIVAPSDGYYTDVWRVQPVCVAAWSQRTSVQLSEMYRSGGSWNETFWHRPDFDALLDAARAELDTEKRKKMYWQLQETLYEEGGNFVPFNINVIRVHRKNISGYDAASVFYQRWYKIRKTE